MNVAMVDIKAEIKSLEAAALKAAERIADAARRDRHLPRRGTTRWRRQDEAWFTYILWEAHSAETAKRQPRIAWLQRKLDRITQTDSNSPQLVV